MRFKRCCGKLGTASTTAATLERALEAQRLGVLAEAIRLYEAHLARNPGDFDALHLRAVALFQMGCIEDSREGFQQLLEKHPSLPRAAWTNLSLLAAALYPLEHDERAGLARARHAAWKGAVRQALTAGESRGAARPPIGVVLVSFNHAAYVEQALRSVRTQSCPPRELVVVDDGSADGSPAIIDRALRDFPPSIRIEFIARGNRGQARSLNEGIDRLSTPWVAPLNADDRFQPGRLSRLGEAAARLGGLGVQFLFGKVHLIDARGTPVGAPLPPRGERVIQANQSFLMHESVGLSLLVRNCTVSPGNQFFSRGLWDRLGGYADLRFNHDWDFALRASHYGEPVHIPEAGYDYRIHGADTTSAGWLEGRDETTLTLGEFFRGSLTVGVSEHAPTHDRWGSAFMAAVACGNALRELPVSASSPLPPHRRVSPHA